MNQVTSIASTTQVAVRLHMSGIVQGVGFRPFIYRQAKKYSIVGMVKNSGNHLIVEASGQRSAIQDFLASIERHPPVRADVHSFDVVELDKPLTHTDFHIASSQTSSSRVNLLHDSVICDPCLAEINDPNDRRYLYFMNSCADCGPRYSITRKFPFDRINTSYSKFTPCKQCNNEYHDENDRRFHVQNIACPDCGPGYSAFHEVTDTLSAKAILKDILASLRSGLVVAIKGTGGYRLYCDARNDKTVGRLRKYKNRGDKPFVLMLSVEIPPEKLNELVVSSWVNLQELKTPQRPVLIFKKNKTQSVLAPNLAPEMDSLGVMFPVNGLEHMMTQELSFPLVATSANMSGENIIYQDDAKNKLTSIADKVYFHNLEICNPCDDSVYLANGKKTYAVRQSRGIAPIEFELPFSIDQPLLAMGGQSKNTISMAWRNRIIVSTHHGDMAEYDGWKSMEKDLAYLKTIYQVEPEHYLVDAHPGYSSTQWLKAQNGSGSEIFHHRAHASSLFSNPYADEISLVFCWDGTGLGEDGSLWGGETFVGTPGNWQRVASFRSIKLPGGELAIRQPARIVLSLLQHTNKKDDCVRDLLNNCDSINKQWSKDLMTPVTSSVGRLFDAASVLLGFNREVSYDGQAAMRLESIADSDTSDSVELPLLFEENRKILQVDWEPLLDMLMQEKLSHAYRAKVFHNSLISVVLKQVEMFRQKYDIHSVGFAGGVFQNKLLKNGIVNALENQDVRIIKNSLPVNDACISYGQIVEYIAAKNRND